MKAHHGMTMDPKQIGRRLLAATTVAAGSLAATATVALAATPAQDVTTSGGGDLWPAFVPLLTAAATVERLVEIGWNYIEWALMRFAHWKAEDLRSAQYGQFKSGTSMVAAMALGILMVRFTDMRMLAYMQPTLPGLLDNVPANWDVILTGIVVGAGSKPAHDLLGVLTRVKNFVGNTAIKQRELAGSAVADYVVKLGAADSQLQVDVSAPAGARSAVSQPARSAEAYVDLVHRSLAEPYG